MTNTLSIGATTGVFYPHTSMREALHLLAGAGVTHLEIGQNYAAPETTEWEEITVDDLAPFSHISLHGPAAAPYTHNDATKQTFEKIAHLQSICELSHVVIHPDKIEDASVFDEVPFVVAFENMDWRNQQYKTVADMRALFERLPSAPMVLDVNHVWTNDRTMQLAQEFYEAFRERIVEVHVGGFRTLHDPLYETRQIEIVRAIEDRSVPLIIESQLASVSDLKKEITYISEAISPHAI